MRGASLLVDSVLLGLSVTFFAATACGQTDSEVKCKRTQTFYDDDGRLRSADSKDPAAWSILRRKCAHELGLSSARFGLNTSAGFFLGYAFTKESTANGVVYGPQLNLSAAVAIPLIYPDPVLSDEDPPYGELVFLRSSAPAFELDLLLALLGSLGTLTPPGNINNGQFTGGGGFLVGLQPGVIWSSKGQPQRVILPISFVVSGTSLDGRTYGIVGGQLSLGMDVRFL